jgi:hypothetical protein
MTAQDYGFYDQYRWSEGTQIYGGISEILYAHIPGIERIAKAGIEDDIKGTDYWVYRKNIDKPLSVDVKARNLDPVKTYGSDDLALETWSIIEKQKIGWTLDTSKETDFILWFFHPTKRFVLLPFLQLLTVAQEHMTTWKHTYKVRNQSSDGGTWHSQCVFVPRTVVLDAITSRFYGNPIQVQPNLFEHLIQQ